MTTVYTAEAFWCKLVDDNDACTGEEQPMRQNNKGFTLVEIMIVVAILGVLGAIAIPLYQGYVRDARLSEAKANLQSIRLLQEQYFADEGEYIDGNYKEGDVGLSDAAKLPAFKPGPPEDLGFEYVVTVTDNDDGEAVAFLAKAIVKGDENFWFSIDQDNTRIKSAGGVVSSW